MLVYTYVAINYKLTKNCTCCNPHTIKVCSKVPEFLFLRRRVKCAILQNERYNELPYFKKERKSEMYDTNIFFKKNLNFFPHRISISAISQWSINWKKPTNLFRVYLTVYGFVWFIRKIFSSLFIACSYIYGFYKCPSKNHSFCICLTICDSFV